MKVHKLSAENAKALRSQTGQTHVNRKIKPEKQRKTKRRVYPRRTCNVTGCSKTPRRLENHLKDTHKITDQKLYRKLLKQAAVVKEFETESECSANESEDSEEEYRAVKKVIRDTNIYDDIIDEDDEDWVKMLQAKFSKNKKENVSSKFFYSFFFYGLCSLLIYYNKHIFPCLGQQP